MRGYHGITMEFFWESASEPVHTLGHWRQPHKGSVGREVNLTSVFPPLFVLI